MAFGGFMDLYLEYVFVQLFSVPMEGKSPDFTMCFSKRCKWTHCFVSLNLRGLIGTSKSYELQRF